MTRALALAFLFCAASPQDDELSRKIDEIVPRLSDDSIDVRDRAVQALADLGPAAIPLLKQRAGELGPETSGRLLEACARIESRNTLAKSLPPLKRVTLDWENRPARDAVEEIGRRTGLAVDPSSGLGAAGDASVTFSLKEATPVEALDELCRRAGLTWRAYDEDSFDARRRAPTAARGTPRIHLQPGKPVEYPATYVRHYRARVTTISMTRTNTFQANSANAQLHLDFSWAPDVKPDSLHSFRITELQDEHGRSLLQEENERFRGRIRTTRRFRPRDPSTQSQYVAFKFPEADARKIAVLKGTAVFTYPQEIRILSIPKPAEAAGKSVELNGLTITLKEFQEKGSGHSLTLVVTGKFQGPGETFDDDGFGSLPFSYQDVELVTGAGDVLRQQGMSGRGDGATYTWTLDFEGDKASGVKEVRINCVLRRFHDEAAFEIRDIALPK